MLLMLISFIACTAFVAAAMHIWSISTKQQRKEFLKIVLKSSLYSAISLSILVTLVFVF